MDIGALSMIMSQSRVQQSVAVDTNVGQNLDTWALVWMKMNN
jgi:hypothetical protein